MENEPLARRIFDVEKSYVYLLFTQSDEKKVIKYWSIFNTIFSYLVVPDKAVFTFTIVPIILILHFIKNQLLPFEATV